MQDKTKDLTDSVTKQLKKLQALQNGAFNNISAKEFPKAASVQADLNHAFRAAKKGDFKALNQLSDKYAGIN